MSFPNERFNKLMLRRRTEAEFRKSCVFQILVRPPFYLGFCPAVFLSSLALGINFGPIAGLQGGVAACRSFSLGHALEMDQMGMLLEMATNI